MATLWTNQSTDTSSTVTLSGQGAITLTVDTLTEGFITCKVTSTNAQLLMRHNETGHIGSFAVMPGHYDIYVAGVGQVTFTLQGAGNTTNTSTAGWAASTAVPALTSEESPIVISPRVLSTHSGYDPVRDLTPSGVVYSASTSVVRKSTNFGATWTNVYDFALGTGNAVVQVRKLANGRLVVMSNNGKLWVSDANEANWGTPKLNTGKAFVFAFGLSTWGDLVAVAEYGSLGSAINAYLSTDGGSTFNVFFTEQSPTGFHIHDIAYDPYENLFWLCGGDGPNKAMIYYSPNQGSNWYQAAPVGGQPLQSSQIVVLPEAVLFVSDDWKVGVARYQRSEAGTPLTGGYLSFDMTMVVARAWHAGEVPITARAAVSYGAPGEAVAYFGWYLPPAAQGGTGDTALQRSEIYATYDGKRFWQVPLNSTNYHNATQGVGLTGIYGPDSAGNLVATVDEQIPQFGYTNYQVAANVWAPR
jgi:hypothetical protein